MTPLEIDCTSVKTRLDAGDEFVFIDCREPDEYDTAHIDGAELLPMSKMQDRIDELESHRSQNIIVHCHHGGRSLRVAMWMRQQGFNHAQSMAGGIDEWSQTIDPSVPRY
ncbi:MAG: rhodanese [Planctomycetaceae bacterium]|nr:rhodanese [Planctomycetaceae bacterium]